MEEVVYIFANLQPKEFGAENTSNFFTFTKFNSFHEIHDLKFPKVQVKHISIQNFLGEHDPDPCRKTCIRLQQSSFNESRYPSWIEAAVTINYIDTNTTKL